MPIFDCRRSLHMIKDDFDKTHMREQCAQLVAEFDEAYGRTVACAPVRSNPYVLTRPQDRIVQGPEAKWEEAILRQWSGANARPVVGLWHRVVTYQMMLRDSKRDLGWGEVDLLAVSSCGRPVIVEIKVNPNDTPAKMLVQAGAYGIAIREAWKVFEPQWTARIAGLAPCPFQLEPDCIPLVCAAPTDYWDQWIGDTATARTVDPMAWRCLRELRRKFDQHDLPSTFVRLDHDGTDRDGLPLNIEPSPIGFLPE